MHYLIYQITNLINGKIYIGKHKTTNINDDYMGSGKHLINSQKKYGIENFKKDILFECSSEEEMNNKERELVNELFIKRSDTYNIKLGGDGGWSYINKNNLSGYNKSHNNFLTLMKNPIYKKEFSNKVSCGLRKYLKNNLYWWNGKKHKEDTKKKIGLANKLNHVGELNPQYGKIWIYNEDLKISKIIKKEELINYIINGWKKGRKMFI